jgi:hypothetical protein
LRGVILKLRRVFFCAMLAAIALPSSPRSAGVSLLNGNGLCHAVTAPLHQSQWSFAGDVADGDLVKLCRLRELCQLSHIRRSTGESVHVDSR